MDLGEHNENTNQLIWRQTQRCITIDTCHHGSSPCKSVAFSFSYLHASFRVREALALHVVVVKTPRPHMHGALLLGRHRIATAMPLVKDD